MINKSRATECLPLKHAAGVAVVVLPSRLLGVQSSPPQPRPCTVHHVLPLNSHASQYTTYTHTLVPLHLLSAPIPPSHSIFNSLSCNDWLPHRCRNCARLSQLFLPVLTLSPCARCFLPVHAGSCAQPVLSAPVHDLFTRCTTSTSAPRSRQHHLFSFLRRTHAHLSFPLPRPITSSH